MTQMNDDELLYTKDELEFRLKVRDWAEKEIRPLVDTITSPDFDYRSYFKKLGDFGLSGLLIPKKYSGSEKPFMYQLIAGEEISAICPSATMMFGASCTLSAIPILRYGTEEQKEKYLVPLAKGEKIGALAITEPKVGSDTAGMVTTAKWDEKEECWILNGEKRYITNASIADQIVVFAITDSSVDSKSGMSAFIIETSWEGFNVEKDFDLMGREGVRISQFSLNNLKVPKENLLGKQNQGFLILMNELDSERVGIAAEALGCMRTPFEIAVTYSQEREQFGRPISRFEGISFKVADMAVKMRAARLLLISAARMIQNDIPCTKEATIAKLYASEVSVECCDMAIQICGGAGYVKDYYPLEKFYRDARLGTIGGGTSEILRFLIQREVYIESRRDSSVLISTEVDDLDFDTMMTSVPNGFRPDRAEGVSAVISFSFDDTDSWFLTIEDKTCTIEKGATESPKMTLKTDSGTWRDILLGKLDAMQAMMTEKVVIDTDDMELLMKFARMFKFTPEILQGVAKPSKQTSDKVAAPVSSKFELGKSLDEIEVGEKAESSMIVSDEHIQLYAQMSGDYNALHMDDDYAATTMFGKRIAHGPIGGALVARVIGTQLPGLGTLAFNMKVSFKAPVYPGDEIRAVVEVTEKVPESNLCRLTFDVFNEDGLVVMDGYANVMPPIKE